MHKKKSTADEMIQKYLDKENAGSGHVLVNKTFLQSYLFFPLKKINLNNSFPLNQS